MRNEIMCLLWKLLIFQCISTGLYAQTAKVSVLPKADSLKIYGLGNQAYAMRKSNPDSALLLTEALTYAKEKKDTIRQIDALHNLGHIMTNSNQYEAAFDYYLKSFFFTKRPKIF